MVPARLALEGVLERCLCRMYVARLRFVPNGECAAANTVVRFGKYDLVEDRTHPVVDAETRFSPSKKAEKDCVPRE